MKISKAVQFLGTMLVCASFLAACGKSDDSAKESKEILLWSSTTGPDGEKIKKTIDNYNATKPAYKVKIVSMQADTFNSKLTTAGKTGKGVPDLALVASEALPSYQKKGMLESWDSMIKGTDLNEDKYVKAAWETGQVDKKQYGIPATMGSWVMYYNQDLVDKYAPGATDDGIVTYEEIEAAGAKAKADGIYSYGYTWGMQNYSNLYLQMGGQWLTDKKLNINNDYSYKAVGEFKKLFDEGYMVPDGEDANKLFVNQKIIFLPEGTWMLSNMQKITDFKWGETFTPQWDANHIVQGSGVDQFAMFKTKTKRSEDKQKGMVDFLTWLQSNQLEWIKSGANPTALAMLENEEYVKMPQSFLLKTPKGQDSLAINTQDGLTYVFSEYDKRSWDMITGKADIKDTFGEIQQIVDQKMQ